MATTKPLETVVSEFNRHLFAEQAYELPDAVTVRAVTREDDQRMKLVIEDSTDEFERVTSVTIRADVKDGFVVEGESSQWRALTGNTDDKIQVGSIRSAVHRISAASWFRDMVFARTFTHNSDFNDDLSDVETLLVTDHASSVDVLHVFQDHLVSVIRSPESISFDQHGLIASFVDHLQSSFWNDFSEVSWSEVYFTMTLLRQARSAFERQIDVSGSSHVLQSYDRSILQLAEVLQGRQYPSVCFDRWFYSDWFVPEFLLYWDETQCDLLDNELDSTGDTLMTPPEVESPTDLVGHVAYRSAPIVLESTMENLPETLEQHEHDVRDIAVVATRITSGILNDDEFLAASRDLSIDAVEFSQRVYSNPDLHLALAELTEEILSIHVNGIESTDESGNPVRVFTLTDRSKELFEDIVFGLIEESGRFLFEDNADETRQIIRSSILLALQSIRSDSVESEVEKTLMRQIQLATRLLENEEMTQSIQDFVTGLLDFSEDMLMDEEVQQHIASLTAVTFELTDAIATQNRPAMVKILQWGMDLGVEGAAQALADPDSAESREALVKSTVALAALGQQEFTSYLLADPNLAPYVEQFDTLIPLLIMDLERRNRCALGRKAPMPAQGDLRHQPEALLATRGEKYWKTSKTMTIDGVEVDINVLQKKYSGNLEAGHLRGEMTVPQGYSSTDVMAAMTRQTQHAHNLTPDLKQNNLLVGAGQAPQDRSNPQNWYVDVDSAEKDQFGNPISYRDAKGHPHYVIHQYLTIGPVKINHVIDLILIETEEAYVLSWNTVSDQYEDYIAGTGLSGTSAKINFGNWYVTKDGTRMGYSVSASGTSTLASAAPGRLAVNIVDMAKFLRAQ